MPDGFTYQVDQGADSFVGHFTSADGKVVVRHDIGYYAGAWAKSGLERRVGGARVWTTTRAVTFPDLDWANFYLSHSSPEGSQVIETIASRYRPRMPR